MWKKYSKIENTSNKIATQFKDELDKAENLDVKFYVLEKIHGCNISIYFNKIEEKIKFFSRNQEITNLSVLGIDTTFERDKIIEKLVEIIEQNFNEKNEITFYGEYFGGIYNGEKNGVKIQNMEYSKENHFMVFDIKVDEEYVDFDIVKKCFSKYPKLLVPILRFDLSFADAMNYNNSYETKVPAIFETDLKENECICVGNVIKPNREIRIGSERLILKNKNSNHSEKKFKQENDNIEYIDFSAYLTNARVESAKSKLMVQFNNEIPTEALILEIRDDILEDHFKDKLNEIKEDKKLYRVYKKAVSKNIYNFLKLL